MPRKPCYQLICISPDGDTKQEGRDFTSIDYAWERNEDMGSRWVFFPMRVIAGPTGKRIVSVPTGMYTDWIGHSVSKLCLAIQNKPEEVLKWLNGEIPFPLYTWEKLQPKQLEKRVDNQLRSRVINLYPQTGESNVLRRLRSVVL